MLMEGKRADHRKRVSSRQAMNGTAAGGRGVHSVSASGGRSGWFHRRSAAMATSLPPLTLRIAAPRGFCAGVDRAIRIVELALERYGPPVYVRHEIVHNRFVVDGLKAKGA